MRAPKLGINVKKERTVVILGAGATRGASFVEEGELKDKPLPPLDADFFTQIQRIQNTTLYRPVRRLIKTIVREFGPAFNLTMEQFMMQIEHLTDFYESLRMGRSRPIAWAESAKKELRQAMINVLKEALEVNSEHRSCKYHDKLANALVFGDVVITFNYDCLIDMSIFKLRKVIFYGYSFQGLSDVFENFFLELKTKLGMKKAISKFTGIQIYKMHGSLNWRCIGADEAGKKIFRFEGKPFEGIREEEVEFIPPLLSKDFKHEPYWSIWKSARKELIYCDNLIIIGYSMPITDLWARSLLFWRHKPFGKTHRGNYLKRLIVVNPNQVVRDKTLRLLRHSIDTHTRVMVFDTFKEFAEFLPEVPEPSSGSS